jgi:hypothetical protein
VKANLLLLAGALALVTAACTSERRTTAGPAPTPAPRPTPTAAPARPAADWRDAPLTPGDWRYGTEASGSMASFGPGLGDALLTLRCQRGESTVTVLRAGAAATAVPLTITTSDGTRAFSATPQPASGGLPTLALRLPARDPLLDSLAFSRGRFAVEAPGLPPLYLPSWSEVGRVVEDCR